MLSARARDAIFQNSGQMHRFPSKHSVTRFRLAALLLAFKYLLLLASVVLVPSSLFIHSRQMTYAGLICLALAGLTLIIQCQVASRANCPLCVTPVLAVKSCVKHRNARRLLGSYRLRVTLAVLFLNRFRCPYCGECSLLQPRERGRR